MSELIKLSEWKSPECGKVLKGSRDSGSDFLGRGE